MYLGARCWIISPSWSGALLSFGYEQLCDQRVMQGVSGPTEEARFYPISSLSPSSHSSLPSLKAFMLYCAFHGEFHGCGLLFSDSTELLDLFITIIRKCTDNALEKGGKSPKQRINFLNFYWLTIKVKMYHWWWVKYSFLAWDRAKLALLWGNWPGRMTEVSVGKHFETSHYCSISFKIVRTRTELVHVSTPKLGQSPTLMGMNSNVQMLIAEGKGHPASGMLLKVWVWV